MVAQISRHRETFATFETRMNLHTRGRIFSDCKIYVWIFLDASSHLYKRVYRSVRPSVHNACAKNRVSRLFLATVRFYTETNDQPTYFESAIYYFTRLFVHLSHDQYTQRHSPDASLPGRAGWIAINTIPIILTHITIMPLFPAPLHVPLSTPLHFCLRYKSIFFCQCVSLFFPQFLILSSLFSAVILFFLSFNRCYKRSFFFRVLSLWCHFMSHFLPKPCFFFSPLTSTVSLNCQNFKWKLFTNLLPKSFFSLSSTFLTLIDAGRLLLATQAWVALCMYSVP